MRAYESIRLRNETISKTGPENPVPDAVVVRLLTMNMMMLLSFCSVFKFLNED